MLRLASDASGDGAKWSTRGVVRESEFLRLLNERSSRLPWRPGVDLGIGDDAAILDLATSPKIAVTTDMLLDGVDFELASCGYRAAGRKAIHKNLSDLAAMGAEPMACFVSVALPERISESECSELLDGLIETSENYGCRIAGGDTKRSPSCLVINIAMIGRAIGFEFLRRSGARPGDAIYVSGSLGGSILGHHLTFEPRLDLSGLLVASNSVSAAIDLSDGLSTDLHHLCDASGVGAEIEAVRIPLSSAAQELSARDGRSALEHALNDGEDYELLFCVRDGWRFQELFHDGTSVPALTRIGTVVDRSSGVRLRFPQADGTVRSEPLRAGGFEHDFDASAPAPRPAPPGDLS